MAKEHTVVVGKKETMQYVLAVATHFFTGSREVVVAAHGSSISRAVDVAEIVRTRFVPQAKYRDVQLDTERVKGEDGTTTEIPAVRIRLGR